MLLQFETFCMLDFQICISVALKVLNKNARSDDTIGSVTTLLLDDNK